MKIVWQSSGKNGTRKTGVKEPKQRIIKKPIVEVTPAARKLKEAGELGEARRIEELSPAARNLEEPAPAAGDPKDLEPVPAARNPKESVPAAKNLEEEKKWRS